MRRSRSRSRSDIITILVFAVLVAIVVALLWDALNSPRCSEYLAADPVRQERMARRWAASDEVGIPYREPQVPDGLAAICLSVPGNPKIMDVRP